MTLCIEYLYFQELFKRLIPHQCLGATWSRRDKNEANTVVATVTQFNAVSFRVISSILIEPKLRPQVNGPWQYLFQLQRNIFTFMPIFVYVFIFMFAVLGTSHHNCDMDRYCTRTTSTQKFLIAEGHRFRSSIKRNLSLVKNVGGIGPRKGKLFPICCLGLVFSYELYQSLSDFTTVWHGQFMHIDSLLCILI